jgi:hypothetical protein
MLTPPLKKGMTVRNIGGTQHFWCHHCHRWNPDHPTATHDKTKTYNYTPVATKTGQQEPSGLQVSPHTTFIQPPHAMFAGAQASFRETIFNGTRGAGN